MSESWHRHYPLDGLNETVGLTLEEHGMLALIKDVYYLRNGTMPFDPAYLGGHFGRRPSSAKKIVESLAVKGRIRLEGGFIRHDSMDEILAEKERRSEVARKGGKASKPPAPAPKHGEKCGESVGKVGEKCAESVSKVDPALNDFNGLTEQIREEKRREEKKKRDTNVSPKKGSRLPEDWSPSDIDREYARSKGLSRRRIDEESERFANYWFSKSGADAVKRDWHRTWRNWVLNDLRYAARGYSRRGCNQETYADQARSRISEQRHRGKGEAASGEWDGFGKAFGLGGNVVRIASGGRS